MVTLTCAVCKNKFQKRQRANKYCSRECYYEMKRMRGDKVNWTKEMREKMSKNYMGKNNPMFGRKGYWTGKKRTNITGENHPNWKGGCYKSKEGYIVHTINGKGVAEQRIVIEQHFGRKLKSTEIIHHKNGKRDDNRLSNLQLVTRAEHIEIHRNDLLEAKKVAAKNLGL